MSKKMRLLGGWVIDENMNKCKLPAEVKSAFNEAMTGFTGAAYTPVLYVGCQVVAGMNYMLICKQRLVVPEKVEGVVQMTIYKPLKDKAVITEIKPILDYKFTN